MKKLIIALVAALMLPLSAGAHLAAGDDVIKDKYIIDFGYEPKDLMYAEPATLAFNLVDEMKRSPIPFSHVWVRISLDNAIAFSGNLAQTIPGNVIMQFVPPAAGKFEVKARFHDKTGEKLTEHNFTINVASKDAQAEKSNYGKTIFLPEDPGIWVSLFIVLAVLAFFVRMAKRGAKK